MFIFDQAFIFVTWLIYSILAGMVAENKGRSGLWYFFLSIILSPVIGFVAALIAKPDTDVLEQQQIKSGAKKRCPFCAEAIKKKAITCRFCGKDLPEAVTQRLPQP